MPLKCPQLKFKTETLQQLVRNMTENNQQPRCDTAGAAVGHFGFVKVTL